MTERERKGERSWVCWGGRGRRRRGSRRGEDIWRLTDKNMQAALRLRKRGGPHGDTRRKPAQRRRESGRGFFCADRRVGRFCGGEAEGGSARFGRRAGLPDQAV